MAFTENLDQFFDTDDFAVSAVITKTGGATVNVPVIFNTPSQSVEIYDTAIETDAPFCQVQTSKIPGVKKGNTITVEAKSYTIEKISNDGSGVSTLFLK